MRKIYFLLLVISMSMYCSFAQVSAYSFVQSSGTYNEISGGTALHTGAYDDAQTSITIPFTFTFNGVGYTTINVVTNGFIYFGTSNSSLSSYTNASVIGGTLVTTGAIAPWAVDGSGMSSIGGKTSEVSWKTIGTTPNRTIVIQYKNVRPNYSTSSATAPFINFQVILYETTNVVQIVYGTSGLAAGTANTNVTPQIGLRGGNNSDYNNRRNTTSVSFNSSTAGTSNTATQAYSSVNSTPGVPSSGLTYTWTPPSCSAPTGVTSSNLATTTATISWTAPTSAPSSGYQYEVRSSGAAGSGATGLVSSGSTSAGVVTTNLTGLTANTTYSVYVRSNCGSSTFSGWTSASTFTTLCNPSTAPTSLQTFTTYVPSCWYEATGAVGAPSTLTLANSKWASSTGFANTGANPGVKINLYSTYPGDWIISEQIDLGATPGLFKLKFKYAVTSYNGTTTQSTLGTHIVRVIISTDGGTTWTSANTLRTYTGVGSYSNVGQTESIDLLGYSGLVRIGFVATTSSTSPDIDFHIDDFEVVSNPLCTVPSAQPTSLVFSGTTVSSSIASFTAASGGPSGYLAIGTTTNTPPTSPVDGTAYAVGTSALGGIILSNGSSTSFSQNGLLPATTYYVWIYSYNDNCQGEPKYLTISPLTGSVTTLSCSISGTKSVGVGGDYATLTAAVADLNSNGLSGPVTLSLTSNYSSASETFPIVIPNLACASSANTLTIKPGTGVTATITGSSESSILKINGGDYIIIDGSNSTNGTSRDLTISNTNNSTSSAVVWIGSASSSNGATNNMIKNTIISGQSGQSTFVGIFAGSGTTIGSQAEASNSNFIISNNLIQKSSYGLAVVGASTADEGLLIQNNTIGSDVSSDYVGFAGLALWNTLGAQVSGNIIKNIQTLSTNPRGIWLNSGSISTFVDRNNINNINYTGTGGYGGKGIDVVPASASANITLSNNFISEIKGDGWSALTSDAIVGIRIAASGAAGGVKLYNNTVQLGSGSIAGYATGTLNAAVYFGSSASNLDVRNNIFANNIVNTNGSSSAKSYSIYSAAASSAFATIDNNSYAVSGSQGVLGYIGSDRTSLSAIATGFGGNSNSQNFYPSFVSATNSHLTNTAGDNWCLESAGAPISSVTTDIDGDARDASRPDIGADEFNATGFSITNPAAVCAPSTIDLTAAAVTDGTIAGATFTYFTDIAATTALTTPAAVAAGGTYYIKATNGSCSWIKPVTVTINPQPTPSVSGENAVCAASTGKVYSVTNVSGNTYAWTVTGGTVTAGAGTSSITVTWGAAGTGTVEVLETITATGCTQANTLSVTVNPNPTPTIAGSTAVCTTNEGYVYSVANVTGNTYVWAVTGGTITAGAGTNSITVTWGAVGAGSVSVTETVTATGCETTATATINIQDLPSVTHTIVEPLTCASEDGQINLTVGGSGAAGPYTYAWTGTGQGITAATQNQSAISTGFYNYTVTAANGCTASATNVVVAGPGGCFICPNTGTIGVSSPIICQNTSNTISVSGLADMGITYGIRFKYSTTPLANPYLSTAGTVMGTVTNANLTGSGTGASITYTFPTAGVMYVYAILTPNSPDPTCRPFAVTTFEVAATPDLTEPDSQVICSGSTTNPVFFNATPAATTSFTWTNSATGIGLAASGTGDIPSFTATNYTSAPVTATIVVTPTNTQSSNVRLNYTVYSTHNGNGDQTQYPAGPSNTTEFDFMLNTANSNTTVHQIGTAPASLLLNNGINCFYCGATELTDGGVSVPNNGDYYALKVTGTFTPSESGLYTFRVRGDDAVEVKIGGTVVVAEYGLHGINPYSSGTINLTAGTTYTFQALMQEYGGGDALDVNWSKPSGNGGYAIHQDELGAMGTATCVGPTQTFTYTVNPIPTVNTVANQTVCSGATATLPFSGFVPGTVYEWTNSNTAIGLAASGAGTLSYTATNTTSSPITATIIVTPKFTNGGVTCTGTPVSFTITVNPTPTVDAVSNQALCAGSATDAISFTGATTGTVYNWTNSHTGIGLAASGTGNIASFTATNSTSAPITATITVTPTYTGAGFTCTGTARTFTITVNPIPSVTAVANRIICAGSSNTINLTGPVTGTTYTWSNSNTAIGLAASGTGNINFTATNPGPDQISSTVTVTPSYTTTAGAGRMNYTIYSTHGGNGNTSQYPAGPSNATEFDNLMNTANTNTVVYSTGTAAASLLLKNGINNAYYAAAGQELFDAGIPIPNNADYYALKVTGVLTAAETGTYEFAIRGDDAVEVRINGTAVAAHYGLHGISGYRTGSINLVAGQSYSIEMRMQEYGGGEAVELVWKRPSQSGYNANLDEISQGSTTCTGTPITFTIAVNPVGQVNTVSNQALCNGSATSAVTFTTTNNGLIASGGSQTASSGTIAVAIPDANAAGVSHTIPVTLPAGAVISSMSVNFNITHTWVGDLSINLVAPNGQILNLVNRRGSLGDNFTNTTLSPSATTPIASGTAPFTGTFLPDAAIGVGATGFESSAANFAALYGTGSGDWKLVIRDHAGGDNGTLTNWSMSFTYAVQGAFGTNMNWTNSNTSIGLGASGTGHIPSFTATNTGAAPVTSTVTVTPVYFNGGTSCPGTPITYTYTVNPTPTVNTVATQTLCAGTPATVNHTGAVTGTVYSWTNSNTAIGLAASGTGSLSFTPTNTGTTPITATITVTPSFTNAGVTCIGTPRTYTIIVNPVGQVNAVNSQVLCNGSATTAVTFATVNGGGTTTPGTQTASSGTIAVAIPDANAAGVTHTIPVTLPAGATVTGVTANFNITHTWVGDLGINLVAPNGQILNLVDRRGGSGDNFTNTTVSPNATATFAGGAAPFTGTFLPDAAIGVGATNLVSTAANFNALYSVGSGDWKLVIRDYVGGDAGTLTGWSLTFNYNTITPAVTTYAWTNNTPSIGLAASGTGNIASFTATNTTAAPVTSTVTVTPTYTNNGVGCAGTPITYTYTVNPTPTVNVVANQTVCRGSNVAAIAFSGATTGTVYTWTNSNTAVGLAASGTGDIASFVGTNTTAAPITATITVTPRYTNAGVTCVGTPRTFTITVNPIPTVNAVTSFPVCHNSPVSVPFSGATTGTVYSWTNTNPAIGLAASGTGNLSFTATNPSTGGAPITATITVTPSYTNNGVTCVGTPTSFTITVNPLPVVSAGTVPTRICISDTLVKLNGTPVGGSWSGIGTSGTNFIPTATNIGSYALTYTYADNNGCVNRASITANVLACEERNRDLDNGAVVLYPNPNSGQFNLRINSTRFNVLGMKVYNTAGQLVSVKQWGGLVYARVIPVNLTNLSAGIYVVRLYYGDGMDRGADKSYQIIIAR